MLNEVISSMAFNKSIIHINNETEKETFVILNEVSL
jgi:hypothetical protein